MSGYTENTRNCLRRIARHDELQFSKDSIVNVMEKFVKTVNVMDDTILVPCRLMDRQVGDSTDITPTPGKDVTSNQHTFLPNANGKRNTVNSKNVHEFLHSSELFNLYNMLNGLKNDLLWTGKDDSEDLEEQIKSCLDIVEAKTESTMCTANSSSSINNSSSSSSSGSTSSAKGHARRPSTASMASIASVSQMSDSESDISNENDSGVESESNKNGSGCDSNSTSSSEDGHVQNKKPANVDKATELAKRCRRHLNGLYQCLEQMTEAANYLTARYQSDIGGPV